MIKELQVNNIKLNKHQGLKKKVINDKKLKTKTKVIIQI